MKRIICWFRHQYFQLPVVWNGKHRKWMHWCGRCGDWREISRNTLEHKVRQIMDEVP